jgi:hypothetical protein
MTHPDQRYTVRNLQHADLIAEAERERQIREAEGMDGGKRATWMWFGAGRWIGAAAGALGAIMVALSIMLPWGSPAGTVASGRPHNRIFADEMLYRPSIAEYRALPPVVDMPAIALARPNLVVAQGHQQPCAMIVLTGLALCAPTSETQHQAARTSGPR